ncbi:hypothetical protein BDV36DRAFT_123790 [Aspergillus pseudocaelatus]|uniref:Secreted protein n=1 Tax=Aspergillus pseudocaelatus TaxID=1825620 RepID=A0ABQ6VZT3_9EURO|nr:hypothetical protein BDV36DRAFT_123790 [Aspergillus pseudocaelatus]
MGVFFFFFFFFFSTITITTTLDAVLQVATRKGIHLFLFFFSFCFHCPFPGLTSRTEINFDPPLTDTIHSHDSPPQELPDPVSVWDRERERERERERVCVCVSRLRSLFLFLFLFLFFFFFFFPTRRSESIAYLCKADMT